MNDESGSPSAKTVLRDIAAIVPILVVAGVMLMLLGQTAALSPGEFTVVDLEQSDSPVDEYEAVDVSATIRNTGDFTETQSVRFTLGQATKERSVTLEPGESETIWLRGVAAESLGIGETAYRIRTGDDAQSATLTVDSQRPPEFAVSDLQPTAATLADDETRNTISARIENVGGQSGETLVEFQIANKTYHRELVALDPGASKRFVVANLDLGWLQPGTHSYAISTANDSVRGSFNVPEPATLELPDVDASGGPLDVDEPVTVSFTVENTGDLAAEETVKLVVGGTILRSETVALESGASTRIAFEDIDPSRLGIGVHRYHLRVGDATASGTWVIEGDEPASFEITSLEPRSITVKEGGSFDIAGTIENTGEQTGNQTVEVRFRGVTRYEERIALPPGERVDFGVHNLSLAGIPPGEYEYAVVTEGAEQTGRVLIVAGTEDGADGGGDGGGDETAEGDDEDREDGEDEEDRQTAETDEEDGVGNSSGNETAGGDSGSDETAGRDGDEDQEDEEEKEDDEEVDDDEDAGESGPPDHAGPDGADDDGNATDDSDDRGPPEHANTDDDKERGPPDHAGPGDDDADEEEED